MTKEEKREYDKQWRINNLSHIKKLNKIWREKNKEIHRKQKYEYRSRNVIKLRLTGCYTRAIKKNIECNITEEDLKNLVIKQNNKCIYSDISFDKPRGHYSMSVDRIDSTKGYTIDNIQLICTIVNKMKSNLTEDEFKNIIEKIYVKFFEKR